MPLSPQPLPLAASTSPLSSSVAVCAVHDLPGSYTRADAPKGQTSPTLPATRTLPSGSSVAVGPSGIPSVLPAAAQVPLAGSYNSAEANIGYSSPSPQQPPTTSTLPSRSSVAVWLARAKTISPVGVHVRP